MFTKNLVKKLIALMAVATVALAPISANTQSAAELKRRQEKKNEWRNLSYLAGALGLYGLLKNDSTLFFAGAAGTLYSLDRYEKDRKSQKELERKRAEIFSVGSFTRDGHKYKRRTVKKNGKKYYRFVRVS